MNIVDYIQKSHCKRGKIMINRLAFLLLIVFSLALANCSGESEKTTTKKGEEAMTEKIRESSSVEKVDVDVSGETVRIKSKEGNVTISGGEGISLPGLFPKDIPIYEGAKILHSMESIEEKAVSVSLTTKNNQATVVEYYKSTMKSQNWEEKGLMELPTQKILMYAKGNRNANLVIASVEEQTQIIITTTEEE
jgi:hypothetical protein